MGIQFRSYSKYKKVDDSAWLREVPAHWNVPRLGALLTERKEFNERVQVTKVLSVMKERGVIPYEDKGNVGNKKSEDISRYKIVYPNDIVMNCMNVIIGSSGLSKYTGCLSPIYYVLTRRFESEDMQYLASIFQTRPFYKSLIRIGNGILLHRMRVPMELLKCEIIPHPPPEEQAAIARFLGWASGKIEGAVTEKGKFLKLLVEQRRAIIHRAVTRGLDSSVLLKPSGIPWLGDIPSHWDIRRIKTIVTNVNKKSPCVGGLYVDLDSIEGWTGKFIPKRGDDLYAENAKFFVKNDVLFGKLRPYLAKVVCTHFSGVCASELFVLRSLKGFLFAPYMSYLFLSEKFIEVVSSSTFGAKMPRTDWNLFGNLLIPIPPIKEQKAVVKYLDATTTKIDGAIASTRREIELLREYRIRLISDAVTGKIDVRGFTPPDGKNGGKKGKHADKN